MIKFGEWLPDQGSFNSPGTVEVLNAVPVADGYSEFTSLSIGSTALNSYCRGAYAARANDDVTYNYAGSGSKLYQLASGTWTDQSLASGTYGIGDEDSWEFAKWGNKVITVGGPSVVPQIITLGSVGSTEFANLTTSPPNAKHIGVVRDFVVMGNTNESSVQYPNRVRWSGINDETIWTTDQASMADYQDLQSEAGGRVQKIVGGRYGTIFQEFSVWRMSYIGPPFVFAFDEVMTGKGTPAPNSIVQYGEDIFALMQTGFVNISGGSVVTGIGADKIDSWFFSELDEYYMHRVVGALDMVNSRIVWIFPGIGNASGLPNKGLVFDLDTGRWSHFEYDLEWLYNSYGETVTLEGLDAYGTVDTLPFSLDSRRWSGAAINLSGFDSDHKSGAFEGAALSATIETKEQRLSSGRTTINKVRPEIQGSSSTITLSLGERDAQNDSLTWTDESSEERDGTHAFRSDRFYHKFRAKISGGFEHAKGVTLVEGGKSSMY